MARARRTAALHPDRKEIARYLLSRGIEQIEDEGERAAPLRALALVAAPKKPAFEFPDGLAPVPAPVSPAPAPSDRLPRADVVVVTWTVDEWAALAKVMTPGVSPAKWHQYTRGFESKYAKKIRSGAPAAQSKRLGSYLPVSVGGTSVLCMKSELHLNQDGVKTGEGTATLPVKDFFQQIIAEAKPQLVLTIGTAGGVFEAFELGDTVITRAAKFRLQMEFRNESFNGKTYKSDWQIPTSQFANALELMKTVKLDLVEPPFAPPTKRYPFKRKPIKAPANTPDIKLEQDGKDMPEFHPILTTDYFEYGTSANRLDKEGAAVEMGDAALGLACSELSKPPNWAAIRNMSDPVINGDLPAKEFHLNEQTTWAVGYYTAYGKYTSICSALATWAVIAGLNGPSGSTLA
jgi:nucleoside phosphorylase